MKKRLVPTSRLYNLFIASTPEPLNFTEQSTLHELYFSFKMILSDFFFSLSSFYKVVGKSCATVIGRNKIPVLGESEVLVQFINTIRQVIVMQDFLLSQRM